MSFKTIAGRFDGVFYWFPALYEDQEKICRIHQNYLVALIVLNLWIMNGRIVKKSMSRKKRRYKDGINKKYVFTFYTLSSLYTLLHAGEHPR